MKKILKLSTIILLIVGFAFAINFYGSKNPAKAALPPIPSGHLWPSVKLVNYNANDQPDDWVSSHYDWLESANEPVSYWYQKNPGVSTNIYYEWVSFGMVGEWETVSPDLTGRWYNWSINNNYDWENGFLHIGSDTYDDVKDGPGQEMDARFRYVLCSGIPGQFCPDANYSSTSLPKIWGDNAWKGTANLSLATAGSTIYFGRMDKFDQLNITFDAVPPSGWQGSLQYSTGTGTWADLPISSQTWNGATWTVNFSSAASANQLASQWKRAQVNSQPKFWGPQGVYFIKLTTTNSVSTSEPKLMKTYSRHYWTHQFDVSNNFTGNIIPGWNSSNDPNHDGYVDDTEYTNRPDKTASARYKYESRIPLYWSWYSYVTNLRDTNLSQVLPQLAVDILNARKTNGYSDYGAYLDDSGGNYPVFLGDGTTPHIDPTNKLLEYPNMDIPTIATNWQNDWVSMLQGGSTTFHNNNYAMGGGDGGVDRVTSIFDFVLREGAWNSGCQRGANVGAYGSWEGVMWAPNSSWSKYGDMGKPMLWNWMLNLYSTMEIQNFSSSGYRATVINGSKTVTGAGTHWLETAEPGSIFSLAPPGTTEAWGVIQSVDSDTSLTLKDPWGANSASNNGFDIFSIRDKMAGLTSFMVMQKFSTDYLMMWPCCSYYYYKAKVPWANWIGDPANPTSSAIAVDYGSATGNLLGKQARGTRGAFVFSTGTDPTSSFPYFIYGRDYSKALVLYRPVTYVGRYDSSSAVTVDLPAGETWYKVNYDGTFSNVPSTKVTLRGAEGAIFMKGSQINGVSLYKTSNKTISKPGDTVTYTISYRNGISQSNAAIISDNISSATTFISATNSGVYDLLNKKVTWTLGNLSPGATGTVSFQVRIN